MHTSVVRSQRHRRHVERHPSGAARAGQFVLVAIPLLVASFVLLAVAGGVAFAVAGYTYYAKDLPDPKQALEAIDYAQQTTVYDRTGKIQLAKLGTDRRELVAFADIPPELVDATTSIEDKTFWENTGFDPVGFVSAAIDTLQGNERGGSTITQQLVRSRLLPERFTGADANRYEKKAREIIQSIRLTEAYPGVAGK